MPFYQKVFVHQYRQFYILFSYGIVGGFIIPTNHFNKFFHNLTSFYFFELLVLLEIVFLFLIVCGCVVLPTHSSGIGTNTPLRFL